MHFSSFASKSYSHPMAGIISGPQAADQGNKRTSQDRTLQLTPEKKKTYLGCIAGFTKKDACFPKLKNIPNLHSDDGEGKIIENIDFQYFSNRVSFMGNPVSVLSCLETREHVLTVLSATSETRGDLWTDHSC